jgi:Putative glycosyl/glycerophosphate transferases involved in teichoic acid biosynthesis TagF/TagB/EpsJ/RodC
MRQLGGSWTNLIRLIMRAISGYALLCNILALAAIVGALLAPSDTSAYVLLVLAAAVFLISPVLAVIRRLRDGGPIRLLMGEGALPRILLGLTALMMGVDEGNRTSVIITCALLCLLVLGELSLRSTVNLALPQVANIPGWKVPVPSTVLANWFFTANTVAILLTGLSAMLGFTAIPAFVLAAASLALAVAIGLQAVRYLYFRGRFESNLPKILESMGPVFAFHWQAPAGTAYQAAMWLPYLKRLDRPYFILVRTAPNFDEVAKLTDAPIILRNRLEDLDSVVCPSLKTVFYANTAVRNSHMIRFPHLTHIQLNHGDSDKIASVSPTFRQYDRNFVAGQAAIDRFAIHGVETNPEQFVIVGRPQLESVQVGALPISQVAEPVVLYSPTWSGFYEDSDYSSLPAGTKIVQALLDRGCTVIFRPHPYARKHRGNSAACDEVISLLTQSAKDTGRAHVFGATAETEMSVFDCFNASDAMISDVSSLVSDYLISEKPFAMVAVSAHGEQFLTEFPMAKAAYVMDATRSGELTGIDECLDGLLGLDPKLAERRSVRAYYLGAASPSESAERFLQQARSFL